MTIPLNDAAVAFLRSKGAPMTTANLNRAMNIVYAQRNGQSGDEQLPDTGNDAATRITKSIDRTMQPRANNTASSGPRDPMSNTRSQSATPSQTGSTSTAVSQDEADRMTLADPSMNKTGTGYNSPATQYNLQEGSAKSPGMLDKGTSQDYTLTADDEAAEPKPDSESAEGEGGHFGDALVGGGVATSAALASRLAKFLSDSEAPTMAMQGEVIPPTRSNASGAIGRAGETLGNAPMPGVRNNTGTAVDLPNLQATNMRVHPGTNVAAQAAEPGMFDMIGDIVRRLVTHGH